VLSKEEKKAQAAVLRLNFPVSSGMQHRARESEWQPVTTGSATATTTTTTTEPDARPQHEVLLFSVSGIHCLTISQIQLPLWTILDAV